jgi:hypothetical protein
MKTDEKEAAPRGVVVTERTAEIVMAVFMFAIGVVMVVDNYQLGAGWAKEGPQSGYFPLRIGAIICIAAAIVVLQTIFARRPSTKVFVTGERLKPVLLVLLPTALYVLAIQLIGIYVSSTLFIGGFMRIMGRYGWGKTALVSVGFSAVLFWLFEVQFLVPLPKGPLEQMFGY